MYTGGLSRTRNRHCVFDTHYDSLSVRSPAAAFGNHEILPSYQCSPHTNFGTRRRHSFTQFVLLGVTPLSDVARTRLALEGSDCFLALG